MEKFIFMFITPEGPVYELVTNEGDNVYWANCNGTMLTMQEIVDILNQQELELKG